MTPTEATIIRALADRNSGGFQCGCTARDIADTTGLDRVRVEGALFCLIVDGAVVAARTNAGVENRGWPIPLYRLAA